MRATVSDFGPQLLAKILGANQTQEQSLGLVFHYADAKGLPLVDLADLRALLTFLDSDDGKAELKGIGGLSRRDRRRAAARARRPRGGWRQRVLRRAAVRDRRPAAGGGGRARGDLVPRAARRAGQAEAVLDRADVAAGRAVRGAAGGRRPREAEARVLLRRGAPAVRRRHRRVPRLRRADRAADPLQGRRRVLRHPEPAGPAGRGARPARLAHPARAARVHARRREGAARDGLDVSQVGLLRPRGAADPDGDRRGGGDGALGPRHPDAGRPHAAGGAGGEHGPGARRRRRREGVAAVRALRRAARQPQRARDPRRAAGGAEAAAADGDGARAAAEARAQGAQGARAPAGGDIGDFLNSREGKQLQKQVIRGVFGMLRKRL